MRNMCSVGRAFFTLVSGVYSLALVSAYLRRRVPYVQPTALCLRRQLFRVRTACPVYLVLDDRSTAIKVSNHSLHRLRHVYGAWLKMGDAAGAIDDGVCGRSGHRCYNVAKGNRSTGENMLYGTG